MFVVDNDQVTLFVPTMDISQRGEETGTLQSRTHGLTLKGEVKTDQKNQNQQIFRLRGNSNAWGLAGRRGRQILNGPVRVLFVLRAARLLLSFFFRLCAAGGWLRTSSWNSFVG